MATADASAAGKTGAFPLPRLEPGFRPLVLERRMFRASVRASGRETPLKLAATTPSGQTLVFGTVVYEIGRAHV